MALIPIGVIDPSQSSKTNMEVPSDTPVGDLTQAMVEAMGLPTIGSNGRLLRYQLHLRAFDGNVVRLNNNRTLSQNGVNNDAVLQLTVDSTESDATMWGPVSIGAEPDMKTLELLADIISSKIEARLLVKINEVIDLSEKDNALIKGTLLVRPSFGIPSKNTQYRNDVFMLMPFNKESDSIYNPFIVQVVKSFNLSIKRGDDFFSGHNTSIMDEIWSAIYSCKFIIADCTGRNPNVFYEIGIAHAIGKPTILLTQNIDDVPFDIQNRRFIKYQNNASGIKELELKLRETINILLREIKEAPS